jgi:hypothetical protein
MGLATHLGPWLLGTVKNTTNVYSGTLSNVGASIVAQTKVVAYGDAANSKAFTLPAGSLITSIQLIQTTTFTGSTGSFNISLLQASYPSSTPSSATQIATQSITTGTAGILTFAPGTAAQAQLFANVDGSTAAGAASATIPLDVNIYYTCTSLTAGAGVLVIAYMVRNPDGTYLPTYTTAP